MFSRKVQDWEMFALYFFKAQNVYVLKEKTKQNVQ